MSPPTYQIECLRLSINEYMASVAEEILCVFDKQHLKLHVRVFVLERLSAAAAWTCNLFQREMKTLEIETLLEKQNNLLDIDVDTDIHPNTAEERSPSRVQEEPQPDEMIVRLEPEEVSTFTFHRKTRCNTLSEERSPSLVQEEPQPDEMVVKYEDEEEAVSTFTLLHRKTRCDTLPEHHRDRSTVSREMASKRHSALSEEQQEMGERRTLFDVMFQPALKLYRIDLLQERRSSLVQEVPQPPQIEEEQEELLQKPEEACGSTQTSQAVISDDDDADDYDDAADDDDGENRETEPVTQCMKTQADVEDCGTSQARDTPNVTHTTSETHDGSDLRIEPAAKCASVSIHALGRKEDGSRKYDKKQFCLFCGLGVAKIARHLASAHSKEPEVAKALSFPKASKQRRVHLDELRNKGNFAHNAKVLEKGAGTLVVRKRTKLASSVEDYTHCVHCQSLYIKATLWKHLKRCKFNSDNPKPGPNVTDTHTSETNDSSDLVTEPAPLDSPAKIVSGIRTRAKGASVQQEPLQKPEEACESTQALLAVIGGGDDDDEDNHDDHADDADYHPDDHDDDDDYHPDDHDDDGENRETEPVASTSTQHMKTHADVEDSGTSQPFRDDQLLSSCCADGVEDPPAATERHAKLSDRQVRLPRDKTDVTDTHISKPRSGSDLGSELAPQSASVSISAPGKREDGSRKYDKKHFCLFCGLAPLKIARHLESAHSKEPEVAKALSFPKFSKQRRVRLDELRNKGDIANNARVLETGAGTLVVRKRPKRASSVKDYTHCVHCQLLFIKGTLWRHLKNCKLKPVGDNPTPGQNVTGTHSGSASVSIPAVARKEDGKKQFCLFCGLAVRKIARHLQNSHSKEPEVAKALSFPKASKQRRVHLDKLRNKGNFAHNAKVLETGAGTLVVRKRPKRASSVEDYTHCDHCFTLFTKTALGSHKKQCKFKPDSDNPTPDQALSASAEPSLCGVSEDVWELFFKMNQDKIANAENLDDIHTDPRENADSEDMVERQADDTRAEVMEGAESAQDGETHSAEHGQTEPTRDGRCSSEPMDTSTTSTVAVQPAVGAQQQKRRIWGPEERAAVEGHFKSYIKACKVPGKRACDRCLESEPALGERDWKEIKYYVYNKIATLKKKM